MNLSSNKKEIYICLCATLVRSPPLLLENLDLSEADKLAVLKLADDDGLSKTVDNLAIRCHVMPSMKQGWISSLSLHLPPDSPFASYKDLCRYWKNQYGYRLPKTDEEIIYCQLSFWSPSYGKKFTYPNVCLRISPI